MPAFSTSTDIGNRALQHCRMARVSSIDPPDQSTNAQEVSFVYEKVRNAEMQRNLWKFATRRVILRAAGIDTVLWTPPAWVSGSSYAVGTVVGYAPALGFYAGVISYWQLAVAESNSTTTPDQDPNWHHYCGPLAIDLYNTGSQGSGSTSAVNDAEVYQAGEIVLVPATYSAGTTYAINQVVNYDNAWYVSLANSNTGNTPSSSPADWALWTSIGRGQGSYGQTATNSPIPLSYPGAFSVYISLYSNNADNPAGGTVNWLSVGGTITPLQVQWPLGAGPLDDTTTNNGFYLPNNFLRRAPTDPKGGQLGYLGANSGVNPEDWVFEGSFIVSGDAGPIMMRFVADITDVTAMDAMFCEGLAARIAKEVAPILVADDKRLALVLVDIRDAYKTAMGEARTANSIETGPISMVENRYVTVRI